MHCPHQDDKAWYIVLIPELLPGQSAEFELNYLHLTDSQSGHMGLYGFPDQEINENYVGLPCLIVRIRRNRKNAIFS